MERIWLFLTVGVQTKFKKQIVFTHNSYFEIGFHSKGMLRFFFLRVLSQHHVRDNLSCSLKILASCLNEFIRFQFQNFDSHTHPEAVETVSIKLNVIVLNCRSKRPVFHCLFINWQSNFEVTSFVDRVFKCYL